MKIVLKLVSAFALWQVADASDEIIKKVAENAAHAGMREAKVNAATNAIRNGTVKPCQAKLSIRQPSIVQHIQVKSQKAKLVSFLKTRRAKADEALLKAATSGRYVETGVRRVGEI